MTRKARTDVNSMILTRMFALAEQIGEAGVSGETAPLLEEFVALGYQIGLPVPPPGEDVQEALRASGLLTRERKSEADLTDEEIAEVERGMGAKIG